MSGAPELDAVTAAADRMLPGGTVEAVGSRAWLVRVTTPDGAYSVRQLDPKLTASRIELIHEFLGQPGLRHATPLVGTEYAGSSAYDVRRWFAGATSAGALVESEWDTLHLPGEIPIDTLDSIAGALGVFHQTGTNASILARVPQLKVKETLVTTRRALDHYERRLAGELRKESRARRWLSAARPLLASAETALQGAEFLRDEPLVVAHLSLWGSHIVSDGEDSHVFLDCSRIGAAPAALDIAQLLAYGGNWTDERAERLLQRYTDGRPLPPRQRRTLPWLVALEAIPSCGRLLTRAEDERQPLSDSDRRTVFVAADLQLELLASLVSAFVPPPPRKHRRPGRKPSRRAT